MLSLLIIAVIVFALVKRHRCRHWFWDSNTGRVDDRDYDSDRMSRRFEHAAEKFERKLRRRFDRQTRKYGLASADPLEDAPSPACYLA